ncbi:5'-3' exoribonuclease 3 [Acorus gramineus]|uniref:5'-3' exoribonuclease n=1 Tax=Acorus gramineus TaxID=55184 RepID=A0AAV9AIJ1_ACOGR|nr:5'-3' exoribonuclease 3 [Acorus gramineus]
MGVPSFYRWLLNRYPKVVETAKEDASEPNPNGFELDNLYLDMNGIIHPCFHPEDTLVQPTTYDEVFVSIFEYIDRIFCIVRPRKLLYMAIDGVAPRAKMNQQRSRRFRTAKDAEVMEAEEIKLRRKYELEGKVVHPKLESEVSDSNVITPGTVFMQKLSCALEYYIHLKLNKDLLWKGIKVILSDANVLGEGEHKIMSFIKLQRNLPGYDPNTRHCLYGLDADLIMLALATHEVHFYILCEDVLVQNQDYSNIPTLERGLSKVECESVKSRSWFKQLQETKGGRVVAKKPYQFLNVSTLREYVKLDLMSPDMDPMDFEGVVDDFIFMCFLAGNDFLPPLPSIDIHEGGIDLLIAVYKSEFKSMGGHLIDTTKMKEKKAAYIKEKRVERFIVALGSYEERIFQKRYKLRQRRLQRMSCEMLQSVSLNADQHDENTICDSVVTMKSERDNGYSGALDVELVDKNTKELNQELKEIIRKNSDIFREGVVDTDKVRLGIPGWKARYYKEKFHAENLTEMEIKRKEVVQKYVEGLCWVLQYYFAGVWSWSWYFPYHYAPFASDVKVPSISDITFKIGTPFKPFDQLMGVLPPRSAHALPTPYGRLMTLEDSKIIDFYPNEFDIDMDGKRFMWQVSSCSFCLNACFC